MFRVAVSRCALAVYLIEVIGLSSHAGGRVVVVCVKCRLSGLLRGSVPLSFSSSVVCSSWVEEVG